MYNLTFGLYQAIFPMGTNSTGKEFGVLTLCELKRKGQTHWKLTLAIAKDFMRTASLLTSLKHSSSAHFLFTSFFKFFIGVLSKKVLLSIFSKFGVACV